jgi:hypothetical protein
MQCRSIVPVSFHGDVLDAVQDERGVWVSVKRACENIGLDNEGQRQRLENEHWATTCVMQAVGNDGKSYEMLAVHIDCLPMWLATSESDFFS